MRSCYCVNRRVGVVYMSDVSDSVVISVYKPTIITFLQGHPDSVCLTQAYILCIGI